MLNNLFEVQNFKIQNFYVILKYKIQNTKSTLYFKYYISKVFKICPVLIIAY